MKISKLQKIILSAAVTAIVIAVTFLIKRQQNGDDFLAVEVIPFQHHQGWGYDIKVDHKLYIRQENIPAIGGNIPFHSREDAMRMGNMMMKKLIDGQQLPSVSIDEVKDLGITITQEGSN